MSRRVGFIHPTAIIGEPAECRADEPDGGWYIHPTATIEALVTVDAGTFRNTWIGTDVWLMKKVHVGHGVQILEGVEVAPMVNIEGECTICAYAKIGGSTVIRPKTTVGPRARIGCGSVVVKDVPAGETWAGNPAKRLPDKRRGERCAKCGIEDCGATPSSTEREPISQPILARRVISTSATTTTPASAPETPSPASPAEQAAEAWQELADMPAKPTTTRPVPPGAATGTSAPSAAKPVHGTRPWTQVYPTRVDR